MGHFSPRAFAAAMSRTVTRRPLLAPPYSGSGVVRGPVAAMVTAASCDMLVDLRVSCRPSGVPGQLDDGTTAGLRGIRNFVLEDWGDGRFRGSGYPGGGLSPARGAARPGLRDRDRRRARARGRPGRAPSR